MVPVASKTAVITSASTLGSTTGFSALAIIFSAVSVATVVAAPLGSYLGELIGWRNVSHDREFVSSLATRVLEITPERVIDFSGNYEDYLRSKGIE